MRITIIIAVVCVLLNISATSLKSQNQFSEEEKKIKQVKIPHRLFGLTIDESSLNENLGKPIPDLIENILIELRKLKAEQKGNNKSLTIRIVLPVECLKKDNRNNCIVFGDPNKLEDKYVSLIEKIHTESLAIVMAEVMDSYFSKACFVKKGGELDPELSKSCYMDRIESLSSRLGKNVDIWEIGNEINGDWFGGMQSEENADNLRRKIVWLQIEAAYQYFKDKTKTAVTYYFNDAGDEPCDLAKEYQRRSLTRCTDSMIDWIKEGANKLHDLDYVLISYYPDDNFYSPPNSDEEKPIDLSVSDWTRIFSLIKNNYSEKTNFGIGEMGPHCKFEKCDKKASCERINVDYVCNRNSGCCPATQEKIIKDDYIDLDENIRRTLTDDTMKKRFMGGYFYWFYSQDVINKMVYGNKRIKKQADNTRKAFINAVRKWNASILTETLSLSQNRTLSGENEVISEPKIRILQPGDTGKTNPYTIVIINNPFIKTNGNLERDPINDAREKFNKSVDYIYVNLFGKIPEQAENFLTDETIKDKIRVVSVWADVSDESESNCLIEIKGQFQARQTAITNFFANLNRNNPNININPDVVFAVTGWEHKFKATAFAARENDCQKGAKFWYDNEPFLHCFSSTEPGSVAINAEDGSMTALHEFSHAASSYHNGYIDDLNQKDFICGNCFTINKKKKGLFGNPKKFARYYLDGENPADENNWFALDKSDSRTKKNILAPEKVNPKFPALMDDYNQAKENQFVKCQHDKLTRQFLLDRIRAKISR